MATETGKPDPTGNDATPDDADQFVFGKRDESKPSLRKKAALPNGLDQVMKEVAPDASNSAGGGMARLERRVGVLEKAFADIVERHEKSLSERIGALSSVEDSIVVVRNRLEQIEKHHAGAMMELRAAIAQTSMRLNGLEAVAKAPEAQSENFLQSEPTFSMAQSEMTIPLTPEPAFVPSEEAEEESCDAPDTSETPPVEETYLAAARRAARAAAVQREDRVDVDTPQPRRSSRLRLVLLGCAAPMVIVAAAVIVLNRHPVTAETVSVPVATTASASAAAPVSPAATGPASTEAGVSPQTALLPPEIVVTNPAGPAAVEIASPLALGDLQAKAKAGDVAAERDLGLKYLHGDGIQVDEAEAARWLLSAAYKGEATAEYWLGTLYARGHGVPADAAQAAHWYQAAAGQGNLRAMHSLAIANIEGWGMAKNPTEAAKWFQKAADLGFADAQYNLAVLFERGTGVPKSLTSAYKWYAIAAARGDKEAGSRVVELTKALTPADLAAARGEAAAFKPAAMDASAKAANGPQASGG